MHSPPRETSLVVTSGSQDGLCKAIEMLTDVGDSIVVEEYIYSGTLGIMNPYDPTYVVIKSDSEGWNL
jgi:DNA-binding transcriptional MocR family regulator